jgi:hypothetical protein
MIFNGIEGIKQLAGEVQAKSFVIHEKGVKNRALRQRSVGSTSKVKKELDKFAQVGEYQNGQYFIMFFDSETAPRTSRESCACATAEFSLGNLPVTHSTPIQETNVVTGLSIGEIEQRAGQIAENAILKYQIEQKDKEIKDLEREVDEPTTDYTEMIMGIVSGFLGNKTPAQAPKGSVNGVNGQIKGSPTKEIRLNASLEESLKRLEKAVGGKKNLQMKLQQLADKVETNPMLLNLL